MSGWITNLIRDAAIVGLIFASAFLPSNPAPIVTTTLLAAFTLTGWIFILKSVGLIG